MVFTCVMREELQVQLVTFLAGEFKREGMRACTRLDLVFAPGNNYRDEEMSSWVRTEDPQLFESLAFIEQLVSKIIEKSESHADTLPPGKHRYVLKTHQASGGRQTESFVLLPSHNGASDEQALVAAGGPKGDREAITTGFNTAMRVNAQMFDGALRAMSNQLANALKTDVEQRERIRHLERENDELRSTRDERVWRMQKEDRGAQRSEKMFSELFSFGKLALTKALGGADGKASAPDRLIILLRELKDTLDQRHMIALQQSFSPAQINMLIEVFMIVEQMEPPTQAPPGAAPNGQGGGTPGQGT